MDFDFFKKPNPLQSFSFNINGLYDLYKSNTTSILNFSSRFIGSDWLIVRLFGYLTCIITYPLAVLYALGSAIVLFIFVVVQYVVNLVGLLFWGLSGIGSALVSIAGMLWGAFTGLLQIVWVRMLAIASIFCSIVIPFFRDINNLIVDKINTFTCPIPTNIFTGDFEGLAWLVFNKCQINYLLQESIKQLLWFIEIMVAIWLARKVIDFVKFVLR